MKYDCAVIKDLMPLYAEGICSEPSGKMVEEHLKECPICNSELSAMKSELIKPLSAGEGEAIKNIKKRIKKEKSKSFKIGLSAAVAIALIFVWFGLKGAAVFFIKTSFTEYSGITVHDVVNITNTSKGSISLNGIRYSIPEGLKENEEASGQNKKAYIENGKNRLALNNTYAGGMITKLAQALPFMTEKRIERYMERQGLENRADLIWHTVNYDAQGISVFSSVFKLRDAFYTAMLGSIETPLCAGYYRIKSESFDAIVYLIGEVDTLMYQTEIEHGDYLWTFALWSYDGDKSEKDMIKILESVSFE